MIVQLLVVTLTGFVAGGVIMALANRAVSAELARARWRKIIVFFLIVHVVLGVAAAGRPWVTVVVGFILAAGTVELRSACRRILQNRDAAVWLVFAIVAIIALGVSWALEPRLFAFLFLVTAACDGFSQVVGQWIGRRPLAPRVSPAKTVEGLAGGLAGAIVVALFTKGLLGDAAVAFTIALALSTGLAGLVGDLAASWVKRRAGIKDFSAALPGQGGFLDRFDSLLGAMAIVGPGLLLAG